jgi:hypothetical protein
MELDQLQTVTIHFRDSEEVLVIEAKAAGFDQIGFLRVQDVSGKTYGIPAPSILYYTSEDHMVSLVQGNFPRTTQ